MPEQYDAFLTHMKDVQNLRAITSVLHWDMETGMPPGGIGARSNQLATIARLSHEMFTSDKTLDLLEAAAQELADTDPDSDAASMVRVTKGDYEDATKLPAEFVAEATRTNALAHENWVKAREAKDFSLFQDMLEKQIEIGLQGAEYLGYEDHPYDALVNQYERGMTTARIQEIFEAHRPALVELIAQISEANQVDDSILHQPFDTENQRQFALDMIRAYGFDFERGAQAVAVHPFCINIGVNDVRITTRFDEEWLNPALFGMMHEAGHGMYEQGVGQGLDGTPLASGTTLGVHESQSRLWENIVGRSKGFWHWALPQLKSTFPQLSDVSVDEFYKAINKVEPSFIRVEADEATYNLHIILRFEIEKGLLEGKIKVKDLPNVWNTKFQEYFGMTPPDDAMGVLQDVHWSSGLLGYFPTYALGNLLSVQYYNKAVSDHPSIPDEITRGKFDTLLNWLRENIHQHGRKFTGEELTQRITGESIQSDDYMKYLRDKFSDIYGL